MLMSTCCELYRDLYLLCHELSLVFVVNDLDLVVHSWGRELVVSGIGHRPRSRGMYLGVGG